MDRDSDSGNCFKFCYNYYINAGKLCHYEYILTSLDFCIGLGTDQTELYTCSQFGELLHHLYDNDSHDGDSIEIIISRWCSGFCGHLKNYPLADI